VAVALQTLECVPLRQLIFPFEYVMTIYQIVTVVGSLRKDSINALLTRALVRLAPADFQFATADIGDLPMFNQDDDEDQAESVKRFKREIQRAHGLLFVTPEYNRSIPAVLKNAIDHASRPYGQNAWAGKPAGILGASPDAVGTAAAQQHLRNILACLDVYAMGPPEIYIHATSDFFDANGHIGTTNRELLQNWMDHFVAWIRRMQSNRAR
jgi:chromate reductase